MGRLRRRSPRGAPRTTRAGLSARVIRVVKSGAGGRRRGVCDMDMTVAVESRWARAAPSLYFPFDNFRERVRAALHVRLLHRAAPPLRSRSLPAHRRRPGVARGGPRAERIARSPELRPDAVARPSLSWVGKRRGRGPCSVRTESAGLGLPPPRLPRQASSPSPPGLPRPVHRERRAARQAREAPGPPALLRPRRRPRRRHRRRRHREAREARGPPLRSHQGPPQEPLADRDEARLAPHPCRRPTGPCTSGTEAVRFVDKQGRSSARHGLEFNHRHPFAMGGDHSPQGMALAYKAHNLYLAEIDYGRAAMARHRRASTGPPGPGPQGKPETRRESPDHLQPCRNTRRRAGEPERALYSGLGRGKIGRECR